MRIIDRLTENGQAGTQWAVLLLGVVMVAGCQRRSLGRIDYVDVRAAPFFAKGDGTTDDTQAIQNALDAMRSRGGGEVFLPRGSYLIRGHLEVPPETSLVGTALAPERYSSDSSGTTLLALEGQGQATGTPFLSLRGPNSMVAGLRIVYPQQVVSEHPVPYPWTIRCGPGDSVAIRNVLLANPYQAIDLGTYLSGRHNIDGLYGQPLYRGIWVDQCYDVGRIRNVHFWPFWSQDKRIIDYSRTNAKAFIFGRSDWEVVEDVFCWGYSVGMELTESKYGATNGQMTDIGFDSVDIGINAMATQEQGVAISNLAVANDDIGQHHIAIWGRGADASQGEGNRAVLFVRGGSFWGKLNRVVQWENPGLLSLADSRLAPWDLSGPMIEVRSGQAMIHDNSLELYPGVMPSAVPGVAVVIGPDVKSVSVHDNQLNGNTVRNDAKDAGRVADNLP
jgi:hypothetical protein